MKVGKKTRQSGQAFIEYILLMAIILSVSGALIASVKMSRDKMWKHIICEVSAACPGCKSTDTAKAVLPQSKVKCKN